MHFILHEYKFQKNNAISLAHELNSGLNGLFGLAKTTKIISCCICMTKKKQDLLEFCSVSTYDFREGSSDRSFYIFEQSYKNIICMHDVVTRIFTLNLIPDIDSALLYYAWVSLRVFSLIKFKEFVFYILKFNGFKQIKSCLTFQ